MEYQAKHTDHARIFRAAILNGVSVPEVSRAALEARLRQQVEFRH